MNGSRYGRLRPSKIHVFLWRLAHHSLPSSVLHHRNMATRSTCSICALECEEITQLMSETQETQPRGWLAAIISSLKHADLTRMVVTLWPISYARRKAIHENSFQSSLSTHCFVNNFIVDLEMIKTVHAVLVRRTQGIPPRWIPPPLGLVNINVDTTTSKN
uniref:Uncharacterized protein n=1 Tax=Setaria viridis TaxID=4556 RepID=A0A4U6WDP9_SETVI|nr:hypothetical protein SEVIR_1G278800v2 [Setaria viridis]